MFWQARTVLIILLAALLIVIGGIGTFTAEAASFKAVVNEVRAAGPYVPLEAYESSPDAVDLVDLMIAPGRPY